MTKLDTQKIESATLKYHLQQQKEFMNTECRSNPLEMRIPRMTHFLDHIFSAEDVETINNTLGLTQAFCIAFPEPEELSDLELFFLDFACTCEALISASKHTPYKVTARENSIYFEPI